MVTWVVSFIASICAAISVGKIDVVLLAYPAYLFTLRGKGARPGTSADAGNCARAVNR